MTEIPFHTVTFETHAQFRQVTKTDRNTYLVPLMEKRKIIELTEEGRNRGSVYIGDPLFSVKILSDSLWLVSGGDNHQFKEVNPYTRETVRTVTSSDVRGASFLFVAELIRYPNGNTLIANWNGHSGDKSQPLLFEIDTDGNIQWRLPFNREIKNISAVYSFMD